MTSSILTDTKKMVGITQDYTAFDVDILMHINTVLSVLNQLGIGPEEGLVVEDDTATWDAFLGDDKRLNNVKTYVYLRVRMLFDPPTTSYLLDAMKEQIRELETRISIYRESYAWANPNPDLDPEVLVIDGGTAFTD